MRSDGEQRQGIVGDSIPKGALVLADCWRITRVLFFPIRIRLRFVAIAAMSSMSFCELCFILSILHFKLFALVVF